MAAADLPPVLLVAPAPLVLEAAAVLVPKEPPAPPVPLVLEPVVVLDPPSIAPAPPAPLVLEAAVVLDPPSVPPEPPVPLAPLVLEAAVVLAPPPVPPELELEPVVVLDPPPVPLVPPSAPASLGAGVQTPSRQVPFEQAVPSGCAGLVHVPVPSWQVPGAWHSSAAAHALTVQQTPSVQKGAGPL